MIRIVKLVIKQLLNVQPVGLIELALIVIARFLKDSTSMIKKSVLNVVLNV